MSPIEGKETRMCHYCGKEGPHTIKKSAKYFEHPHDYTKGTWVFIREYMCDKCKVITKV